jgi:hypothetical protein
VIASNHVGGKHGKGTFGALVQAQTSRGRTPSDNTPRGVPNNSGSLLQRALSQPKNGQSSPQSQPEPEQASQTPQPSPGAVTNLTMSSPTFAVSPTISEVLPQDHYDPPIRFRVLKELALPQLIDYKKGLLCGPTVKAHRYGSLGDEVEYKREDSLNTYDVYCHCDVLGARNLPALDDNGLCEPCWKISVGDQTVLCDDVPSSLNPAYVSRVVIPLRIYIPPIVDYRQHSRPRIRNENGRLLLEVDPETPMPPVRLTLMDRDAGNFGEDEFEEIASVVCLAPTNLDIASKEVTG